MRKQEIESLFNRKERWKYQSKSLCKWKHSTKLHKLQEGSKSNSKTDSHLITTVIDVKQRRNVMTADIINTFVQMAIKNKTNNKQTTMKNRGLLVNMLLIDIDPHVYQNFVKYKDKKKVIYVEMKKALYGMLQSSLLYYKKFRTDLKRIGFIIKPYNL